MNEAVKKDLPENWAQGQIKDIVTIRNGCAFKSKDFNDEGGAPVIRQTNLSSRIVNFNKPKYLPIEFLDEFKSYQIHKGDVLIGLSGSIGNLSRYLLDEPALQNQRTGLLVEHAPGSIKYVEYYLQLIKEQLLDAAKGVAVQNISSKTIENWNIPIAPPEQQKRIAAKIEELFTHIDAGIASLQAAKKLLKQYRQSILKAAVTGELTKDWRKANKDKLEPASDLLKNIEAKKEKLIVNNKLKKQNKLSEIVDDEKLFEIPSEWKWCKFGLVAEFVNGDRGKNYPNKNEYVDSGLPWINTGHINPDGSLSESDMNFITREKFDSLRSGKIREGDLVYCLRGATFGKTAFVYPYKEGSISSSLMIIRPYLTELNTFIYNYLTSSIGKDQLFRFDNGSAQPNLSANNVKLYAFPLPPLLEQKEIKKLLEQKITVIDHVEREIVDQLVKAEKNKQSILMAAFNGELYKRVY